MTYKRPTPVGYTPQSGSASIGEQIRARRTALGLSLQAVADRAGCGRSYLSMIENNLRGDGGAAIGPELLVGLESALGMPIGTLTSAAQWSATPAGVRRQVRAMETSQRAAAAQLKAIIGDPGAAKSAGTNLDDAFKSGRLHALVDRLEATASDGPEAPAPAPRSIPLPAQPLPVQVPLINSVAAGYPREFTDLGYPARVADEYVLTPGVDDPDAFAARVVGESMLPDYREGDIVIFSPARTVKSGMDCFVRLERDGEATFKRIQFDEPHHPGRPPSDVTATRIRLIPLNPKFKPKTVGREDVALLCAAVSVTRKIG